MRTRWSVCLALLVGMALAGLFGLREYSAYLFSTQGPSFKFQTVALEGKPGLPPSVRGQRAVVAGCLEALSPAATAFQVTEDVTRVAARCAEVAEAALAASPTLSVAHLLRAQAAALQEDYTVVVPALQAAAQTAPRTLWLGVRRVRLMRDLPDAVRPLVDDVLRADLDLMFESDTGLRVAAALYESDRALRPVLLEVAEARPPEDQRRFLSLTRRALQRGISG